MKSICRYAICLLGLLLEISFSFHLLAAGKEKGDVVDIPDSMVTDDKVYEYTFSDFAKAQRIMAKLRERKSLSYKLDVVEGDLCFNTGRYYQALKFYNNAFNSPSVQANDTLYMEQVHRLISCYDCLHNETKKAQYVDMLMKKAEQCANKEMQSVAMFNMGKMLYYQGNKEKGYGYMQHAADLMEQTDYKYKYDNLRYNYNTLLTFQELDRRDEEALHTLESLQKVVTRETGNETPMEGLSEKEKKAMYAHYAVVLFRLRRVREADNYYKQFLSTGKEYDHDNYLIMPYLFDHRMYDEVIRMNSAREQILAAQGDTVTYHMTTIKKSLGQVYEKKGDYRSATHYFKELAVLRDSIKNREQKSTALELAALYETHEKDLQIQQRAADVRVRNVGLSLAGCLIVLLGIFLWFAVRHNRVVGNKNRAMVHTIEDLLVYKKELENMRTQELQPSHPADDPLPAVEPTPPGKEEEENRRLFLKLDTIVISRKLFLSPNLLREDLMKLVHVDKNRFSRILQQNTGQNMVAYLNGKRMEYAAEMLKTHPEYNIATVAQLCGTSVSSFNRMFKSKYEMTPAEFRSKM